MLSTYDILGFVILTATLIIYGYAAFSAFAIRRRLFERLYRSQALGIGSVTLLFLAYSVFSQLVSNNFSALHVVLYLAILYIIFVGTFYWIDTSVRTARLSDPLLRDSLRWRRLRIVLWGYDLLAIVFTFSYLAYAQFVAGGISQGPPPVLILFGAVFAPVFITVLSGFVVIPIVIRRSRDKSLRRHLEWFGLYTAIFFVDVVVLGFGTPPSVQKNLMEYAILAVAGYLLYRSGRSLVPIYSFAAETEVKT